MKSTVAWFLAVSSMVGASDGSDQPRSSGQADRSVDVADSPRSAEDKSIPADVEKAVHAWRENFRSAACVRVTLDVTRESRYLETFDESGQPKLLRSRRYLVDAIMTRDALWLEVFAFKDGSVDRTRSIVQLAWRERWATERWWHPALRTHRHRRYVSESPFGADDVLHDDGCMFGTMVTSWLVPDNPSADRILLRNSRGPVERLDSGLVRFPDGNPDVRRDEASGQVLYSRIDESLFDPTEPVFRQWTTRVVNNLDRRDEGPYEIVQTRHYTFDLLAEQPVELDQRISELERVVKHPENRKDALGGDQEKGDD